jgi:DNA-binding MarR family transcriptional regulator
MDDDVPDSGQEPTGPPLGTGSRTGVRQLTDPLELRALAHPVRIKLLAAVGLRGTLTATEAAEFMGGSPASCAYHLRTLAKYGYIEDAGGEDRRERPWRLTQIGLSWNEQAEDTQERAVARAVGDVIHGEWMANIRRYRAASDLYPAEIRQVSGGSEMVLFATPDEVADVQRQIAAVLAPFRERNADPALRPPGHTPLEMIVFTHPVLPPTSRDT